MGSEMCIRDSPPAEDANYNKPTFPHISCTNGPNGDMFVNYMDYTDDAGMFMFTTGQSVRMSACLDGPRASFLVAATAVAPPQPAPELVAAVVGGNGAASATAPAAAPTTAAAADAADGDVAELRRQVASLRSVLDQISSLAALA